MRRRVLLRCSTDAFRPFDYRMPYDKAMRVLGHNSGNLLFLSAIQRYLTHDEVELAVEFFESNSGFSPIDESYDSCIINCANWIGAQTRELLKLLADGLEHVKVPVYLIGLGVQSPSIGNYAFLETIRDEAKAMIRAVLNTGGGFGLRGQFTADVFERLGFRDYSVIGCPSMYQQSPELKISNEKVTRADFNPLINGELYSMDRGFARMYHKYPQSGFVCQNQFYKILYCASELTESDMRNLLKYPDEVLRLLRNGKVKLYADMFTWFRTIKSDGFNFSFGSRVHGNFAAALVGIPAFIHTTDSRTEELADFFSIPHQQTMGTVDLYDLYLQTDYSDFNRLFPRRYDEFCQFLRKHDLPFKLGRNEAYDKIYSQVPENIPPGIADEVKRVIDEYLSYKPPGLLSLFWRDKRFWYLLGKKKMRRLSLLEGKKGLG